MMMVTPMLVELKDKPPANSRPRRQTPRWLLEYNDHHGHLASERWRVESLISQTSHELCSLTKLAEGGARRVVVDQQVAVCAKLLGRLERQLTDNPTFIVSDPVVSAALEKRAQRRQEAADEIANEHNAKQIAFNNLVAQAGRDVDLVRDLAHSLKQDPRWAKQLGQRLRSTAVSLLAILAGADETLNTQMAPNISAWLARTAKLIAQEKTNG